MRSQVRSRRLRQPLRWGLILTLSLALLGPGPLPAQAGDPRLEAAVEHRERVQNDLDSLLQRLYTLEAEIEAAERELASLRATGAAQQSEADNATTVLGLRARETYKRGAVDPTLTLLGSDSPGEVAAQTRLLGLLAVRSQADHEAAAAARTRTAATAADVERVGANLQARRSDVDATRAQVAALLADGVAFGAGAERHLVVKADGAAHIAASGAFIVEQRVNRAVLAHRQP